MSSTIGGEDEYHDFSDAEKDKLEKAMRTKAQELLKQKKTKERKSLLDQAAEISRRKSKKAEHH
ncbi:MAG: hypothetical protein BWK80_03450 [Desulfobacteraceae bacterium IS3]|jgi:hypothetical protein|nr:MAG: hypothetical protein BWK80_03450 [Desulfobacteraceae bacterium IS3]HAO21830.1 hypothetical protein [Desulfobacteraceae bacterium]